MKKIIKRTIPVAALCLMLFSVSTAWFKNNQETTVLGEDSIRIRGDGMLAAAYATDADGTEIEASSAAYGAELPMNLDGKYINLSGNGAVFFEASFNAVGEPMEDGWTTASPDSAVSSSDSGQYVTADIYFKSDSPMDIYLLDESAVSPKSAGEDLVNTGSYSGYTRFSEFADGLPELNINQSAYGLFSRNLIAGACRVSFTEYAREDGDWVLPGQPDVVWVPNSTWQLTTQSDADKLYKMELNGSPEEACQFYDGEGLRTVDRLPQEMGSSLTGILSIRKTEDSDWEALDNKTIDHNQLVPARSIENFVYPIPQIWKTDSFTDAAYCASLGCLAEAEYDSTYSLTNGFAFAASNGTADIRVKENPDGEGYIGVELSGGKWTATGETYTTEEQILTIESSLQKDTADYRITHWMEDSDFSVETQDQSMVSRYRIGSTEDIDGSGGCYTRVRINVWAEGYDREANIALNSGEFTVNLKFYGLKKQE